MLFKLSNLNLNLALTLGYLNPASFANQSFCYFFFFYKGKYKGKIKHISKLVASFLRKKVQGIYIFDITDFFIFFTHCNVCYITTFESILLI